MNEKVALPPEEAPSITEAPQVKGARKKQGTRAARLCTTLMSAPNSS